MAELAILPIVVLLTVVMTRLWAVDDKLNRIISHLDIPEEKTDDET
jgi:hypothetical protein